MQEIKNNKKIICLGIESSCDETSVCVMKGYEVLSCVTASQIDIHRQFGGVVPEIASRNHIEAIDVVTKQALLQAGVDLGHIDAIGVTYGAGLIGALLVGVAYAKSLAYALNIPLYAVNHVQGHLAANYITHADLETPYISLLVSGGHTEVCRVDDINTFVPICQTLDDAAGEAFDKVARLLGLPYPGGPEIDRLAKEGNAVISLPSVYTAKGQFSFSGIKTAVANYLNSSRMRGEDFFAADICSSFNQRAVEGLLTASKHALESTGLKKLVISGGVSANSLLRSQAQKLTKNYQVYLPQLCYCTDNGAMIAARTYQMILTNQPTASLTLNANASLR